MGKPGAQRQREYLKRLKEKNKEEYLEKERMRRKNKRAILRIENPEKYKEELRLDRERKRLGRQMKQMKKIQVVEDVTAGNSEQAINWYMSEIQKALPKSSGERMSNIMGEASAQVQCEYLKQLKEDDKDEYLEKERIRKKNKRANLRMENPEKYEEVLKLDRERKKLGRQMKKIQGEENATVGNSEQAIGWYLAEIQRVLPQSTSLRTTVLSALVNSLPPAEKQIIFTGTREQLAFQPRSPAKIFEMKDQSAIKIWKAADVVCFDVDSTVCQGEGLDDFAKFLGCYKDVSRITNQAMTEGMNFTDSFQARLQLMLPTKEDIARYTFSHPHRLTPNVESLIKKLRMKNIAVYLVSGGILCLIEPVAEALDVPFENVFCNELIFDKNGKFVNFDASCCTSRSGGKAEVIAQIREKTKAEKIVMIGDGMNDYEASSEADLFIGFGGNVIRESVRSKADWYVTDFNELINEL